MSDGHQILAEIKALVSTSAQDMADFRVEVRNDIKALNKEVQGVNVTLPTHDQRITANSKEIAEGKNKWVIPMEDRVTRIEVERKTERAVFWGAITLVTVVPTVVNWMIVTGAGQ